jgi:hypothetical protein
MDVFVEARPNPVFGRGLREAPLRRDLDSAIDFTGYRMPPASWQAINLRKVGQARQRPRVTGRRKLKSLAKVCRR